MMTKRHYLTQASILLGIFLLMNAVLVVISHSRPQQLRQRLQKAGTIDTIFIGNSLTEAGVDPQVYTSACGRGAPGNMRSDAVFNAGLGATGPVEYQMVYRCALKNHAHFQTTIIGTFDTELTKQVPQNGELHGNATFSYLSEPDVAAAYYTNNPVSRALFLANAKIPYLRLRDTLWEKVEILRRRMADIGMPKQEAGGNQFGRGSDFKALEAANTSAFNADCDATVAEHRPLSPPAEDLLQTAKAHSDRVIVVEMPMPTRHRSLFYNSPDWQRYQAYKRQQIEQAGAQYIDASAWLADDDFMDVLHLNKTGAADYSRRLAAQLCVSH